MEMQKILKSKTSGKRTHNMVESQKYLVDQEKLNMED